MIYTPEIYYLANHSRREKARDYLFIAAVGVASLAMTVVGLFVVAVAIPFYYSTVQIKDNRILRHLPKWAWLWSNDHDGIEGDDRLDYQNKIWANYRISRALRKIGLVKIDWFLMCWNWAAVRNSCNNFARFVIGFNFGLVDKIYVVETDAGVYMRAILMDGRTYPSITIFRGERDFLAGWKVQKTRPEARAAIGFALPRLRPHY